MVSLLFLAVATSTPSAEALRLSREIAEGGTLASFVELVQQKETDELVNDHPELSEGDKTALKATAHQVYLKGREKLMQATAEAYAERLSLADLRAIAAFQRSPAGMNYRDAAPAVIAATVQSVGEMDFKGDVIAAYCRETGKLCAK